MKNSIILFFLLFYVASNIGLGLEIPGKAIGSVSPLRGAIYLSKPTPGIGNILQNVCPGNDIYNFTYRFDMTALPDRSETKVILEIYNPETRKWMIAGDQEYDGVQSSVEFKVNYWDLYGDIMQGGAYKFSPFLGMSKFKLVKGGKPKERRVLDGMGFQVERANTIAVAFREDLSDEAIGPEIIANFRNPQANKAQFDENYTYQVDLRLIEPLNINIIGIKGDGNWTIYGGQNEEIGSSIGSTSGMKSYDWKTLLWKGAPRFSRLEFVIGDPNRSCI